MLSMSMEDLDNEITGFLHTYGWYFSKEEWMETYPVATETE